MLSDLLYRMRAVFRHKSMEAELEEELRAHVERQVEKSVQSGLTHEEGARRARLEFGGVDHVKEACRDALVLFFPPQTGGIIVSLPGEIDWRVLVLSAGVCIIATLLVGLVPAYQAGKVDLAGALKSESGGVVGGRARA